MLSLFGISWTIIYQVSEDSLAEIVSVNSLEAISNSDMKENLNEKNSSVLLLPNA